MRARAAALVAGEIRVTKGALLDVVLGLHDRFVALLAERVAALRVGDALDPNTQMGPAVTEAQREVSYNYIDIARDGGGRATGAEKIRYALILSVEAPKHADLYNDILRAYAKTLVPIQPQVSLPIRIR